MDPSLVTTERLLLRRPSRNDLGAVLELHADPDTNRFHRAPTSAGEMRPVFDLWLRRWDEDGFGYWTAALREEPQSLIGVGGLMYKDIAGERVANLYYRLRRSAWGRGYATELARAARRLAFDTLGLDRIVARVHPANTRSIRILERLGMVRAGEIEDPAGATWRYVLLKG